MRRLALAVVSLLVIAAAGYTGYWFYMADRLRIGIDPWAAARRAEGNTVRWDKVAVEGFPTAFRLRFAGAVFGADRPVPYEIRSATLIGEAAPWNLTRWRIRAPEGVTVAAAAAAITLEAAAVDGTVTLGGPEDTLFDLTAHDLTGGGGASGLRIAEAQAQLTVPARAPAGHGDTALGAVLHLTRLALPNAVPPFGGTVEALGLSGAFKGGLPPGPLRPALAAWRDDGGTIELQEGRLIWGPLDATAAGTLALDESLQPIGALTATIEGQNAVIDAAVAAGHMHPGDASLAKTFLGLMAKAGPDGHKQLVLPMSLQNAQLYLGPVGIARLPRFTWQ